MLCVTGASGWIAVVFFYVFRLITGFSSSVWSSVLVVATEQLQRHSVLLRQGSANDHDHDAREVVVVVADEHFDSSRSARGSVDFLEEGDGAFVRGNARSGLHLHVVDLVAWRAVWRNGRVISRALSRDM